MNSSKSILGALPPAVKLILWANIAVYIFSMILSLVVSGWPTDTTLFTFLGPSFKTLAMLGMAHPGHLEHGIWWVLVSAMFLHSGFLHVLFNMLWAKQLAPLLEALLSPSKLLCVWVFSGITGNFFAMQYSAPVVGASGAVFGVMGAIIAAALRRKDLLGRNLALQLGGWAVLLIGFGFMMPNVSNAAHIGGFTCGLAFGLVTPARDSVESYWVFRVLSMLCLALCGYALFAVIMNLLSYLSQAA